MNWLLDVNVVPASRWTTHPDHRAVRAWIDAVDAFYTCAITELSFVRISLGSGYQATWAEVQEALGKLQARPGYRFLPDDVNGAEPPETRSQDTQRIDAWNSEQLPVYEPGLSKVVEQCRGAGASVAGATVSR